MRRWLIRVFVAVSAMITFAFVAPLAVLIRTTAEDRAIDSARADAAAVVPALVADSSAAQVASAVGATTSGVEQRMTVMGPDGLIAGVPVEGSERLAEALLSGASGIGEARGGKEVVTAVADGQGRISAVRVFVPTSDLRQGQWAAWTALGAVALLLTGISVVIADRLARTVVRPTEELAAAAHRLGAGEFTARVTPEGPPELVELGETFNELGARIAETLGRERELLAELSHRIRTPLTPLRMKIDRVDDRELAADLKTDVDEITSIVNDLIEEARRGARRERGARCDAARLVSERVEFWSVLAEDQGRRWRFSRDVDRAEVAIGEDELTAAIDVMLENVFAHTEEGVALAVRVALEDTTRVEIVVDDAGPGFDDDLIGPGRSGTGSTGLGLHIASRTAERMGGELRIERSELGGASVGLVLPLAPRTRVH